MLSSIDTAAVQARVGHQSRVARWLGVWLCIMGLTVSLWPAPLKAGAPRRTTVFIVHGTYGATEDWVRVIPDRVTFASEVKRAVGDSLSVEPFLWRTSIQHGARQKAAESLAREIDRPELQDQSIVIIGHSHGGNVALAAAGICRRRIEAVICLSTPHLYLNTRAAEGGVRSLPIYCSPRARSQIDRIISITIHDDPVVSLFANFRKGLDEQTAIDGTSEWRRTLDHPRLVNDGGPLRELLGDLAGRSPASNLVVGSQLNVADVRMTWACESRGVKLHEQVHSARIGHLLGGALREGFSTEALLHLQSFVLPETSDIGGPLSLQDYGSWYERHRSKMQSSGWVLRKITVTGIPDSKPDARGRKGAWDVDGSPPDLFFRIEFPGSRTKAFESDSVLDIETATWLPRLPLPRDSAVRLVVLDKDLFGRHDLMGRAALMGSSSNSPPVTHIETDTFRADLEWYAGHY